MSDSRIEMDWQFDQGTGLEMPCWGEMLAVYPDAQGLDIRPSIVYEFLEGKMCKYVDYAAVEASDNGEMLVRIPASAHLVANQIGDDMRPFTGDQVFVRERVLERLLTAGNLLGKVASGAQLEIVYGYRALSIQTKLFEKIQAYVLEQGFQGTETDMLEAVHRMVAVPNAAGHPTGGAVDIRITQNGEPIDMGTSVWEFVDDSYTFSPYISKEAWDNRQQLRDVMTEAGFVPFDGEWWHFSYGDPEWAVASNEKNAIYEQIEFKI